MATIELSYQLNRDQQKQMLFESIIAEQVEIYDSSIMRPLVKSYLNYHFSRPSVDRSEKQQMHDTFGALGMGFYPALYVQAMGMIFGFIDPSLVVVGSAMAAGVYVAPFIVINSFIASKDIILRPVWNKNLKDFNQLRLQAPKVLFDGLTLITYDSEPEVKLIN